MLCRRIRLTSLQSVLGASKILRCSRERGDDASRLVKMRYVRTATDIGDVRRKPDGIEPFNLSEHIELGAAVDQVRQDVQDPMFHRGVFDFPVHVASIAAALCVSKCDW